MKRKGLNIFGVILLVVGYASCGDQAIFDDMADSNISIVLKGTYESNNPKNWGVFSPDMNDDTISILPSNYVKSVNPSMTGYDSLPSVFRLDVAEVRINGDKFANYRKTYNAPITDIDPLFNGVGIPLKCDSVVRDKHYSKIELYTRKMIFDNAQSFTPESGVFEKEITTVFDEEYRPGYDINPDQIFTLYDTLREEKSSTNRIFPVDVALPGGFVYDGSARYVIEIRMVIKNFLRRYEKVYVNGNKYRIYHFFGLSDWVHDVRQHDDFIGGNCFSVARVYSPDLVTTISGDCAANSYIVAIPASDVPNLSLYYDFDDTIIDRPDDSYIPRQPSLPSKHISGYLEYYVDMEKYDDFYGDYVLNVNKDDDLDTTSYHNVWDAYNDRRKDLRIPPLATQANALGSYILTNVPPGEYVMYELANPVWGKLPTGYSTATVRNVTVTEADIRSGVTTYDVDF
jgi:hypothetical protein